MSTARSSRWEDACTARLDDACTARWGDACTAAAVLAVDPTGVAGISIRSAPGPVRDAWLACCARMFPRQAKWLRIPLNVGDSRLLGGLDLAATLQAGRPVAEQGILAQADGGVVTLAMAERLSSGVAAKIGCVMDRREVVLERDGFARRSHARFAVIALDEGIEPDERPPASLLERLALHLDLNGLPVSVTADASICQYDISRARHKLASVRVADEIFAALCEVSAAFGVSSARAAWFALRVARALAALEDRAEVEESDVAPAARLVFAPRALVAPGSASPQSQREQQQQEPQQSRQPQPQPPEPPGQPSQPNEASVPPADREAANPTEAGPARGAEGEPSLADAEPLHGNGPHGGESNPTGVTPQPAGSLGERVLAATKASLPADFLSQLQPADARSAGSRQGGRAGGEHISQSRGRPTGTSAGELRPGARVNIVETLRAAAPWQRIRRLASERAAEYRQQRAGRNPQRAAGDPRLAAGDAQPPAGTSQRVARGPQRTADAASPAAIGRPPGTTPRIRVVKDDIRLIRFVRRSRSTTIFLVDASGSAALNRLAEAKGAVELMLAESYVRRDRVALISFRGAAAQLLLPPTNSLVRAKRELASLPGGGGTPLATGLDTARVLAASLKRRGESPMVVVLTDGRPNIARDGKGSRVRAEADTVSAARMMRTSSIASLMVDTAPQPRATTEQFAREMGARYVPLPYADAGVLATVVSQCGRNAHDRQLHV